MAAIYSSLRWRATRSSALRRDGSCCTVARLLGGDCGGGSFHVHHVRPVAEGGAEFDLVNLATVCPSHHPVWEALRRRLLAGLDDDDEREQPARCRHRHMTREGRELCERRMARARGQQVAA